MPKVPRDLSHDRLIRFLRREGWPVVREGARHTVVGRPGRHVAVPRHSRLDTGTVAAILRQCGIDPERWSDI
ncbi:MAG TPA: type II toxin-antitoxin system HicA family toxin [Candidatus Thermoplasmatota archaeon]|nr:type II toxin-antitoxin system HicA family toxin [Candidatus Thermoplasmatota archaeon]